MPRQRRRADPALVAIVAEGFFSRLSFGLLSFALPLYAYQRFGLGLTEIGILASFNLAVAIVLKPILGSVADRIGMRPSFLAAIGLRSVVSLLLVFATMPWQLFAVRGIHGFSIALRDPPANVLLAELGGKKAVASAFAWYQTAKSVAGAIGKASAGVLLTLTASNFSLVFLLAFVLSALPVFIVARYVREPDRGDEHADETAEPSDEAAEYPSTGLAARAVDPVHPSGSAARPTPALLPFAGLGFLISGTAYMLANLFPIFAVEYAGLSEAETGFIYLISIVVVLTGPVFGWLSDHVSRRLVLSIRSVANVLSSAVYLVFPSFAGIAVGRGIDDLGKAAFRPAWGSLMAHVAGFDKRRRARTMGSLSAGEDAGEVAGPILAGFIWSMWGVPVLLGVRIALAVLTEIYAVVLGRSLELRDLADTEGADSRPDLVPGHGLLVLEGVSLDGDPIPVSAVVGAREVAAYVGAPPAHALAVLVGVRLPTRGTVLIDGQNLQRCSPASVERAVAELRLAPPPDDQHVGETLTRRWPAAPPEELVRVWALAGLDDEIGSVFENTHRHVGDLAPLDRIRLALAASLVGDPAVLVFDDSQSRSSAELAAAVERILAGHPGAILVLNPTAERLETADVVVGGGSAAARATLA